MLLGAPREGQLEGATAQGACLKLKLNTRAANTQHVALGRGQWAAQNVTSI